MRVGEDATVPPSDPTPTPTPRMFGAYRLLRPLGQGGMGEVWEARHEGLDRPAAIKLMSRRLDPSGNRSDLKARFDREVRAMSRLRSPHTVQVYDYGVADDGTLFYAMELLDGLDLRTLVLRHGEEIRNPPQPWYTILVPILPFTGQRHDEELKALLWFLESLGRETDVRPISKRGWRPHAEFE